VRPGQDRPWRQAARSVPPCRASQPDRLSECLSPKLALALLAEGQHFEVHPRNSGGFGDPGHRVLKPCTAEGTVLVIENARDFRALAACTDIHPGMIFLPCLGRRIVEVLIRAAIAHLETFESPGDVMVKHVLESTRLAPLRYTLCPGRDRLAPTSSRCVSIV